MKTLINIFKYTDYKKFLIDAELEVSKYQKGFRSRLAESLKIQNAFVSKVLNSSKAHFSLEQAMGVAEFMECEKDEASYLIWLVERGRAGTPELKKFFDELIGEAQNKNLDIKNRVGPITSLSDENQNRFYSHWLYGAAHVLASVPQFQNASSMADALSVDVKALQEVLAFLAGCGLIKFETSKDQRAQRFVIGPTQLHLHKSSSNIMKHHTNWRVRAIDDASKLNASGIHYSTVSSLSEKDFEKLRVTLTGVIQAYVETIRPSPEETACCFNIDFFKIVR